VPRGHKYVPFRGVYAKNGRPQQGHSLRNQARTAADIKDMHARQGQSWTGITSKEKRQALGEMPNPRSVKNMDHLECAVGLAPLVCLGIEACYLGRIGGPRH
jgi:hypothetical protein